MSDRDERLGEDEALGRNEGLEQRLRAALARVDAPEGFAGRVLARVEGGPALRADGVSDGVGSDRGRRAFESGAGASRTDALVANAGWWRAVAAAFLLGALSGGWLMHQERVERRQAMRTEEQFRVAMEVTARVTERSFAEAGRRIGRSSDRREQVEDGGNRNEGATR